MKGEFTVSPTKVVYLRTDFWKLVKKLDECKIKIKDKPRKKTKEEKVQEKRSFLLVTFHIMKYFRLVLVGAGAKTGRSGKALKYDDQFLTDCHKLETYLWNMLKKSDEDLLRQIPAVRKQYDDFLINFKPFVLQVEKGAKKIIRFNSKTSCLALKPNVDVLKSLYEKLSRNSKYFLGNMNESQRSIPQLPKEKFKELIPLDESLYDSINDISGDDLESFMTPFTDVIDNLIQTLVDAGYGHTEQGKKPGVTLSFLVACQDIKKYSDKIARLGEEFLVIRDFEKHFLKFGKSLDFFVTNLRKQYNHHRLVLSRNRTGKTGLNVSALCVKKNIDMLDEFLEELKEALKALVENMLEGDEGSSSYYSLSPDREISKLENSFSQDDEEEIIGRKKPKVEFTLSYVLSQDNLSKLEARLTALNVVDPRDVDINKKNLRNAVSSIWKTSQKIIDLAVKNSKYVPKMEWERGYTKEFTNKLEKISDNAKIVSQLLKKYKVPDNYGGSDLESEGDYGDLEEQYEELYQKNHELCAKFVKTLDWFLQILRKQMRRRNRFDSIEIKASMVGMYKSSEINAHISPFCTLNNISKLEQLKSVLEAMTTGSNYLKLVIKEEPKEQSTEENEVYSELEDMDGDEVSSDFG